MSDLLQWNLTQGHILTGAGKLDQFSVPDKDFAPSDLPHYLLKNKITRKQFKEWKDKRKVSTSLIGAWSRPLFAGGWKESSDTDTSAYNLQTPSIFIDMRFPTARPDDMLKKHSSLEECSDQELVYLARQHCFSGYSFPEENDKNGRQPVDKENPPLIFTRHHVIDWNCHPHFPRPRPNRWFIELQLPSKDSFKEHSTIRDANNIPVYFERWQRREPFQKQMVKYLAMRRKTLCPKIRAQQITNNGGEDVEDRDAILVVVGNHFALAVDRNYKNVLSHMQEHFLNNSAHGCKGAGPAFVDHLLANPEVTTTDTVTGVSVTNRQIAIDYLDLEGSYGQIYELHGPTKSTTPGVPNYTKRGSGQPTWKIMKSTMPWKEGQSILKRGDISVQFPRQSATTTAAQPIMPSVTWFSSAGAKYRTSDINRSRNVSMGANITSSNSGDGGAKCGANPHCVGEWEMIECSFTRSELEQIFLISNDAFPRSRL